MIEIRLHEHAKQDMHLHFSDQKEVLGFLKVLFNEMKTNDDLLDVLLTHRDHFDLGDRVINVQQWVTQFRRRGRNLWRLKPLESVGGKPLPFRIIYAYKPPEGGLPAEIWILGVFPRNWAEDNFQYEEDNVLAQRVINDYDNLD